MLAVRFDHFGPPADLQIQKVPKPTLTTEEVLVEIHAAGVNPSDGKNVLGNMENTTLPRTPGRDFAGIVAEGPYEQVLKGGAGRVMLNTAIAQNLRDREQWFVINTVK